MRRQRKMVDIHVNVTKHKRLEEHKDLLIRELDHRFKNMLSVISVSVVLGTVGPTLLARNAMHHFAQRCVRELIACPPASRRDRGSSLCC